jgi:hypothetical protein
MFNSEKSERSSKWPPITTVLIASVLIAIVSCGGGFALDGVQNGWSQLAGVLSVVGLFAILVAIISGFVAVVGGLFEHFKND